MENLIDKKGVPLNELSISIFGLSYKPDIDDLRESPSLDIALQISNMPFKKISILEPNLKTIPKIFQNKVEFNEDLDASLESDILLFLVATSKIDGFENLPLKIDGFDRTHRTRADATTAQLSRAVSEIKKIRKT